jgi:hypothetical protein
MLVANDSHFRPSAKPDAHGPVTSTSRAAASPCGPRRANSDASASLTSIPRSGASSIAIFANHASLRTPRRRSSPPAPASRSTSTASPSSSPAARAQRHPHLLGAHPPPHLGHEFHECPRRESSRAQAPGRMGTLGDGRAIQPPRSGARSPRIYRIRSTRHTKPPLVSRPPQQSAAFRGRRRKTNDGPLRPVVSRKTRWAERESNPHSQRRLIYSQL